jgi:hypothetical protein
MTRRAALLLFALLAACASTEPGFEAPHYLKQEFREETRRAEDYAETFAVLPPDQARNRWRVSPASQGFGEFSHSLSTKAVDGVADPQEPEPESRAGEFVGAPIPFRNPTVGWGIAAVASYLFPLDKSDRVSPPSSVALGGLYAENGSWAVFGGMRGYAKQDDWRFTVGGAYGDFRYDFYGVGAEPGEGGLFVPLRQEFVGVLLEGMGRVFERVYFGPRYLYGYSKVSAELPTPPGIDLPPLETDATISAIGLRMQRDTRDSTFYPTIGSFLDVTADFHDPSWGDSFEYQVFKSAYNQYISYSETSVLAVRGYGQFTFGDPPFWALAQYGQRSDLRGYQVGRYQDAMMYTVQAEYRWMFARRWGLVGFAGTGAVAEKISDFSFDNMLPSVGLGVRFTLATQNRINLRFDVAYGRDGTEYYIALGESF